MACSNNELGATVGGVHYSLRNLSRSLNYIKTSLKLNSGNNNRLEYCLYNALALGFASGLNLDSIRHYNLIVKEEIGLIADKLSPKI